MKKAAGSLFTRRYVSILVQKARHRLGPLFRLTSSGSLRRRPVRLDNDRRPVAQNFRRPDHGSGVVAHADDGVGAYLPGVANHEFKRFRAGGLAEIGEDPGAAAE